MLFFSFICNLFFIYNKQRDFFMNRIFFLLLFLVTCVFSLGFCDEDDSWDEYYFEKPNPIEWEGHLWEPYMLMHSKECPCYLEGPEEVETRYPPPGMNGPLQN